MGNMSDVTNTKSNLAAATRRLNDSDISEDNKNIINGFALALRRENLQRNTIITHTNIMRWTCEHLKALGIDKPVSTLTPDDFDALIFFLEDEKESPTGTINQFKKTFKKFSKHYYGEDNLPLWISKIRQKKTQNRIQPADIPTREEFTHFLESAKHPRDKAMIAVMADGGLRIGALLSCKISSVDQTKHGMMLYLSREGTNKTTSAKGIPLTWSSGYLGQWLAIHPLKYNPNAPLWTTLRTYDGHVEVLTYDGAYQMFAVTERLAGLNKHIHPHLMRHYAVTNWILDGLREADINHRAGWTQDSKQMQVIYGNFTEGEINDRIWEHYGLKTEDKRSVVLKKCPRCTNILKPDDKFCSQCALVLDQATAVDLEKGKENVNSALAELQSLDPELLQQLVNALKGKGNQ